jgi:Subtilase family/Dockerin type I domain
VFSVLEEALIFKTKGRLICALLIFVSICLCSSIASADNPVPTQPAALDYAGIFKVRQSNPELTGQDVTIAAVCRSLTYIDGYPQDDYRLNINHNCFGQSNITFIDSVEAQAGLSNHATAIGAILCGADPNGFFNETGYFKYEGAAPAANLNVHEFWRFLVNYIYGGQEVEADVLTFSVGGSFEDWWTRGIERLVEKTGLVTVAGIGNGTEVDDTLLYPAASSNVIGVGVIDSVICTNTAKTLGNFSIPFPEHSSCGPTYDQRAKPDIVAPGNCLAPLSDGQDQYDITGDFTSFATPIVSGTTALLIQKAKEEPGLQAALSNNNANCVIKAILLSSADKLVGWHKGLAGKADDHSAVLDQTQGAGAINAAGALELLTAGQNTTGIVKATGWDNDTIQKEQLVENVYEFEFADLKGDQFITATLSWNFHYLDEYPFRRAAEQTDLRLELWATGNDDPEQEYLLDYSDSATNNLEHIHYAVDPNYNNYKLIVTLGNDQQNNNAGLQNYGLAWQTAKKTVKDIYWYDLNGDEKIDSMDIGMMLENMSGDQEETPYRLIGDINLDGTIDIEDAKLLMSRRE